MAAATSSSWVSRADELDICVVTNSSSGTKGGGRKRRFSTTMAKISNPKAAKVIDMPTMLSVSPCAIASITYLQQHQN
jgi:hypothetical protein